MIGGEVGNFVIVQKLGHGGMGEVFLAEQKNVKTKVAIKTLLPHISSNRDYVQRFFNEAIAVSRIKHSGIAKIFDVGFLPSGQAYLVMEFLEGETLASRIEKTRLSVAQLSDIGRQIASVLDATHQAGITHRDLKPENVFLVPDAELESGERVKVLDFGIAKLGAGSPLTNTSIGAMGTPAYMAPEQWQNSKLVDWRADAYSLGCLTFEMAAGRPPFQVTSIAEACTAHLAAIPPPLRSLAPGMPQGLEELVRSLLEKDPARRPASMKDIMRRFAELGRGTAATAMAPAAVPAAAPVFDTTLSHASSSVGVRPARTNKLVIAALAATAVIALSAIVLAVMFMHGGPDSVASATQPAHADAAAPTPRPLVAPITEPPPSVATTPVDAAVPVAPPKRSSTVDACHAESLESEGTRHLAAGEDAQALALFEQELACRVSARAFQLAFQAACDLKDVGKAKVYYSHLPQDARQRYAALCVREGISQDELEGRQAAAPTPPATTTHDDGGCDEVSCVLNNYAGACCAKFRKGHSTPPAAASKDSAVPDLDRTMISIAIAAIKPRVYACGDKSSAKGVVKVHVKVGADGRINSVLVSESPDDALSSCVEAAVQRAVFPKTTYGGSFSYPFAF